ncbi:EMB2654 [Symbiodinium natans]|uniref:EMB2654 protein n=1 Tax=Symbiodinium natans TaxID=878477 RepID=A0A812JIN2_9DINO|nr:EMB2654 [Symbiodinium natans]
MPKRLSSPKRPWRLLQRLEADDDADALARTLSELKNKHLLSDPRDATSAIRASGRGLLWPWALELLWDLRMARLDSIIAYSAAMNACKKGGCWPQTVQLLRCARDSVLAIDVVACGTVLSGLKGIEPWPLSLTFLAEMEQNQQLHGNLVVLGRELPRPDVACYTAAVDACASWGSALKVLGKVQARHLQIDPVLLNSVLSSCGGDHWPRLLSQLDAFRTEWSDWGDWGKRIQRSTVTGNILQNALAKAGFWQLGSSWLAWQQLKPNVVTYSCLMAATTPCPADSWRHAVHLLDVMWAQSIRCNPVALSAAVAVLGERWQPSLEIVARLWARRLAPDEGLARSLLATCSGGTRSKLTLGLLGAFGRIRLDSAEVTGAAAQGLAQQAQWQPAAAIAEKLEGQQMLTAFSSLILLRGADGVDVDRALRWWALLRERRVVLDEQAFVAALTACARGGRWWRALGLLRDMALLRVPAGRFSAAASLSAMEGARRWRRALSLLCGFQERAALAMPAVNAAVATCEKGWRWWEAAHLLASLSSGGLQPDQIGSNSLRSAYAAAALWQRALAFGTRHRDVAARHSVPLGFKLSEIRTFERDAVASFVVGDLAWRVGHLHLKFHQLKPGCPVFPCRDEALAPDTAVLWESAVNQTWVGHFLGALAKHELGKSRYRSQPWWMHCRPNAGAKQCNCAPPPVVTARQLEKAPLLPEHRIREWCLM